MPKPLIARFEPFSFDLELGHLWMNGQKIHLPEQNARLLAYLIERSGRLASRDELQHLLWPQDRPSDWDQALTKAISQLRTALRDSASTPRYIETIPQRGYRFCALDAITPSTPASAALPPTDQPSALHGAPLTSAEVAPASSFPVGIGPSPGNRNLMGRRRWVAAVLFLAVAAAAVAGGYRLHALRRAREHRPVTLGIVPFKTKTPEGDSAATALRLALLDGLAESPQLRMIASNSTLNLKPGPDLAPQASQLGLDVVIFGYFIQHGDQFLLCLEVIRARDSTHLATLRYSGTMEQIVATRFWAQRDIIAQINLAQAKLQATNASPPAESPTPALGPLAAASTIPR